MRLLFLILISLLLSCSEQSKIANNNNGYTGTYHDPLTGEILFEIYQDSTGLKYKDISLSPYTYSSDKYEKVILLHEEGNESYWASKCRDIDFLMKRAYGGSDWNENFIWYVQAGELLIANIRKGSKSDEHIFKTNYVVINGSECLNNARVRRNIEKL